MAGPFEFLKRRGLSRDKILELQQKAKAQRDNQESIESGGKEASLEDELMRYKLGENAPNSQKINYGLIKELPEDVEEKEERTRNFKKLKKLFSAE